MQLSIDSNVNVGNEIIGICFSSCHALRPLLPVETPVARLWVVAVMFALNVVTEEHVDLVFR